MSVLTGRIQLAMMHTSLQGPTVHEITLSLLCETQSVMSVNVFRQKLMSYITVQWRMPTGVCVILVLFTSDLIYLHITQ